MHKCSVFQGRVLAHVPEAPTPSLQDSAGGGPEAPSPPGSTELDAHEDPAQLDFRDRSSVPKKH